MGRAVKGLQSRGPQRALRQNLTVLLIEDDSADQLMIHHVVKSGAFRANLRVVSSGSEALEYLTGEGAYKNRQSAPNPDLILMDLNLPGLDGIETLRRIRSGAGTRSIPVIVLTTSDDGDDIAMSYDAGANSFITKPQCVDALYELFRKIDAYWLEAVLLPAARRTDYKQSDDAERLHVE